VRYGLDAPGLVITFFAAACGLLGLAAITGSFGLPRPGLVLAGLAIYPTGMGFLMLYDSLIWKPRAARSILDLVAWTGREEVLDAGCGRGLMLVLAAARLTSGHAVGVDLWRAQDQAQNSAAAALANARVAGVADRVTVQTADMRALPYADAAFDVVVSNWALHNVEPAADRALALAELWRVLRHGGTLLLADIVNRHTYASELKALGAADLRIVVANPVKDRLLSLVSFGSYQPATVVATRP
jgi:arsenite methyltransferase